MGDPLHNSEFWLAVKAPYMQDHEFANCLGHDIIRAYGQTFSLTDILSVQFFQRQWIIYCMNQNIKRQILSLGHLTIGDRQYSVQDFKTLNIRNTAGHRVSIHGLPLHVSEKELETWVDSWSTRCTNVSRAKIRNLPGKETPFPNLLNGNRYCYVKDITNCPPRYISFSMANPIHRKELLEVDLTIWVDNGSQTVNCRLCKSASHQADSCSQKKDKARSCHKCGSVNHMVVNCPESDTIAFRGRFNPLSNLFSCNIQAEGNTFNSSEQYYQWKKAMWHNLEKKASEIRQTGEPEESHRIGKTIKTSADWKSRGQEATMHFAVLAKYDHCAKFREFLANTNSKHLVEATPDLYWGSGLDYMETLQINDNSWPGQNKLGKILMEVRKTPPVTNRTDVTISPIPHSSKTPDPSARIKPQDDEANESLGAMLDTIAITIENAEVGMDAKAGCVSQNTTIKTSTPDGQKRPSEKRKTISPTAESQEKKRTRGKINSLRNYFSNPKGGHHKSPEKDDTKPP